VPLLTVSFEGGLEVESLTSISLPEYVDGEEYWLAVEEE
jgi:hypothetical protein